MSIIRADRSGVEVRMASPTILGDMVRVGGGRWRVEELLVTLLSFRS